MVAAAMRLSEEKVSENEDHMLRILSHIPIF